MSDKNEPQQRQGFDVTSLFTANDKGEFDDVAQKIIKTVQAIADKQANVPLQKRRTKETPDTLRIKLHYPDRAREVAFNHNGKQLKGYLSKLDLLTIATRLYPVFYVSGDKEIKTILFRGADSKLYGINSTDDALFDALDKRNEAEGWLLKEATQEPPSKAPKTKILSADTIGGKYGIHTSQEVQAVGYLLTDGAIGANFTRNEAEGILLHQRKGSPFRVALSTQRQDGKTLETLDDIMQEISEIGGVQALKEFNYILWQLIPAEGETFAEGWLDFGDIWKYTGKSSRSKAARLEAYKHIWRVIKFCEQAEVFGARTGKYRIDGKEVETTITGQPFWHVSQKEYNEGETIPARALLTTPPIMRKLLHTPQLQQYLGYGHLIGGIPSGRAAGAWAVSIGLTFLNHLRINLANGHNLTRRTLLSKYPSEISPYTEVLAGNDPRRAIKYWVDALQILCEQGLIQKEGEALATVNSIRKGLPRYDWQEQFLNQSVVLIPSTREGLKKAIDDIAKNKYKSKPKNLKAPKKRRKKCE